MPTKEKRSKERKDTAESEALETLTPDSAEEESESGEVHAGDKRTQPATEFETNPSDKKKLKTNDNEEQLASEHKAAITMKSVVHSENNPMQSAAFKKFHATLHRDTQHSTDFLSAVSQCLDQPAETSTEELIVGGPSSNQTVYLEDIEAQPLVIPTDRCGVTDPKLQDPALKGHYDGLPFLPAGCEILSWDGSQSNVKGWMHFSAWQTQCPNLNIPLAINSFRFVQAGQYINPSRIHPKHVRAQSVFPGSDQKRLFACGMPAVCISTIYLDKSLLLHGKETGVRQKLVSGVMHEQEWQRFQAFVCLAFTHRHLHAQYKNHALDFSTRGQGDTNSPGDKKLKKASLFGGSTSDSKQHTEDSHSQTHSFKPVLEFDDAIPVYDGRSQNFNFNKDIARIDEILTDFGGEIPEGSFVTVAYTVNDFLKKKDKTWWLSCCLQWAIVCGTPS